MHRLTAPLLTVMLLLLTVSATPTGAQTGCGYPDLSQEGAISLSGDGKLNTRPFELQASAYTVRWAGSAPSKIAPGNLILTLKRTDGPFPQQLLVNTVINKGDPDVAGETQVYLTKGGAHYFDVTAPASWTVTITPQM
jgi:hypothetical protein